MLLFSKTSSSSNITEIYFTWKMQIKPQTIIPAYIFQRTILGTLTDYSCIKSYLIFQKELYCQSLITWYLIGCCLTVYKAVMKMTSLYWKSNMKHDSSQIECRIPKVCWTEKAIKKNNNANTSIDQYTTRKIGRQDPTKQIAISTLRLSSFHILLLK